MQGLALSLARARSLTLDSARWCRALGIGRQAWSQLDLTLAELAQLDAARLLIGTGLSEPVALALAPGLARRRPADALAPGLARAQARYQLDRWDRWD